MISELTDYDPLSTTKCASEPTGRQRNAAPITVAERSERRSIHSLVSRLRALASGFGNGLQQRKGEYLDLRLDARAGRSNDAFATSRKVYKACGNGYAGSIVTIGFERGKERRPGARCCRQRDLIHLHFTWDSRTRSHITLSAVVPSMHAVATVTPPRAAGSNGWKRANSVPKVPLPRREAPA